MTSAHGEPVSPELMQQAAVDVWMFLLIWSLNWQFEGRKVKKRGKLTADASSNSISGTTSETSGS